MKKLSILGAVACLIGLMSGCKETVDFNNINTTMQADFGLAIPVGDMTVTAADFLGGNQVKVIYMDDDGIFHYMDTLDIPTRVFHPIDIKQYIGETHKDFKVYQQLLDNKIINPIGEIKSDWKGKTISLFFPLTLHLDNLNKDPNFERLDSIRVDSARFTSVINVEGLDFLKWDSIKYVDVILGKQFKRAQGDTVRVYTKGDKGGYDQDIPIRINDFMACFMADPQGAPSFENIIDSCEFTFKFNFTIPNTPGTIKILQESAFSYDYKMEMLEFSAIWGYFAASNQVRDHDVRCIQDDWEDWKNVQKMNLRFAEPSIKIGLWHSVAAPLVLDLDTLMASNTNGDRVFAKWNGVDSVKIPLPNVLDPIHDPINASVFNEQLFNHEDSLGHIDQLFDIRPDTFMYSFTMHVDENRKADYPQHRITRNTSISGYVAIDVPMKFNDNMEASYFGKVKDLDFSELDMDSITKKIDEVEYGKAKVLKVFLTMTNNLPFEIDAKVKFLDKDSNDLNVIVFKDSSLNHLHLPAPKLTKGPNGYAYIEKPSQSTFILDVDSAKWKTFTTCKHLDVEGIMGHNTEPCVLEGDNSMTVQVGVAANVEAIVNFNKENEEE